MYCSERKIVHVYEYQFRNKIIISFFNFVKLNFPSGLSDRVYSNDGEQIEIRDF